MLKCLFIWTRQRPFLLPVTSEERVEVIHWQDINYLANVILLYGQTLFKDCFWWVFCLLLVELKVIFLSDYCCKQIASY